ncbi:MAG: acetylglutamate kinase [Pseudomonadota bacterium]
MIPTSEISSHDQARILSQALPYMQRYADQSVVIKFGGHAMGNDELAKQFAQDIALLRQSGVSPIVVHGGGPQIASMLDKLKIQSDFIAGLRVTDAATVEIVEMVLAGSINKQIVSDINRAGGQALGLTGKDADLVTAKRASRIVKDPQSNIEQVVDLGFVGEPTDVRRDVLDRLTGTGLVPVLAPIATGVDGVTYNVNGDTFAGAIAGAVSAKRLLLLTDVPGVLDKSGNLIRDLDAKTAKGLIDDGTIDGGMIPKIETCIQALDAGVEAVVIVDGRVPHAVLLELFTEHGVGTLLH